MTNVMPHDKKVEVIEISTGMFKAYLHANHVPFTIESEGVQRTEYQCDTVLTAPMSFASKESATEFFTEHHDELVEAILAREALAKSKADAEIAQAKLDAGDYKVIKAMEAFLASKGIEIPGREGAEDLRQIIRDYRATLEKV
jgi:hypothetical protein